MPTCRVDYSTENQICDCDGYEYPEYRNRYTDFFSEDSKTEALSLAVNWAVEAIKKNYVCDIQKISWIEDIPIDSFEAIGQALTERNSEIRKKEELAREEQEARSYGYKAKLGLYKSDLEDRAKKHKKRIKALTDIRNDLKDEVVKRRINEINAEVQEYWNIYAEYYAIVMSFPKKYHKYFTMQTLKPVD